MSENIRPQHLARKAILYVRQSSPYQVLHNLESQKLQYAMEERLHQLGWHETEVVDDDLGRSAAGFGHPSRIRAHGGGSLFGESGGSGIVKNNLRAGTKQVGKAIHQWTVLTSPLSRSAMAT